MSEGLRDFSDPNKVFPDSLRFIENSIISFYQAIFMQFQAGQNPSVFHFDDDEDKREVEIQGASADNLRNIDTRPKITVMRGAIGWQHMGQGGNGLVGSQALSTLNRRYTGINRGVVVVSCFSRNDLESDRLAQICFDSVEMFSPIIRRYAGFLSIHPAEAGQRRLIRKDSKPDLFVTPVTLQVSVTRNWNAISADPVKLRDILIQYVTTIV